jgi:hypothetical protein
MKKILVLLALLSAVTVVKAETIATLNNKAGGKIVLTDRPCIHKGVTHDKLNFVYNYDNSGYSSEGCWGIEGEVVSVVWFDSQGTMRYPLVNFVINPNYKGKNRNRSTM